MNASNPARLQTLGPPLAQGLKGLLAHNVFLGAYGIDDDLDIVDPSSSMAQVKQQYVRMRRMSSSSKIGRIGNTKVMPLERVDILITDDEISPADRKRVAKLDIDLIIADHT
jgi:DeoR/GlpR family transcriptional regulator of sugar metabolism